MDPNSNKLTEILKTASAGDAQVVDKIFPLVYEELRRLAAAKMANEMPGQTLQATALVHEAWLRLGGDEQPVWKNRGHYFASAAEAMRRILVEQARKRAAAKRGGGSLRVNVDDVDIPISGPPDERILRVDEALEKFSKVDPRKAELVKLRYFAGLSFEESALALGIAIPTAKGWWAYARAWLSTEMRNPSAT